MNEQSQPRRFVVSRAAQMAGASRAPQPPPALPLKALSMAPEWLRKPAALALSNYETALLGCAKMDPTEGEAYEKLLAALHDDLLAKLDEGMRMAALLGKYSAYAGVQGPLQNYEKILATVLEFVPASQRRSAPSIPGRGLLSWEVLPVEQLNALMRRASFLEERLGAAGRADDFSRIPFLESLEPLQFYVGTHLSEREYVVAEFPRVAIADTSRYGNALFAYQGEGYAWQQVFRRDKREAVRLGAQRIVHSGDWEQRVLDLVRRAR